MKEKNEQEAEVNESRLKSQLAAGTADNRKTSSRKVEANRRNALKSTGPRTTNGKRRVARNAIRHGFFSKWLLVMFTNVSIEVIVFTLTLLSILVLNQQPLVEKPIPDGISCNHSLSVR